MTANTGYIGTDGEVFFDIISHTMRISDGVTPGGNLYVSDDPPDNNLTNIIYVDARMDYTEMQIGVFEPNGEFVTPFLTIQEALDIATSNNTITVAPGTYIEDLVIPNIDGLVIKGSSEINTVITNSSNNHTITWLPNANTGTIVNAFELKNFTVINTATGKDSLHIDASSLLNSNTFCSAEFNITDVYFKGNMYFENVEAVYWKNGYVEGDLYANNCNLFNIDDVDSIGSLNANNCTSFNIKDVKFEGNTHSSFENTETVYWKHGKVDGYLNAVNCASFSITDVNFTSDATFEKIEKAQWNSGEVGGDLNVTNSASFKAKNVTIGTSAIPANANFAYNASAITNSALNRIDYTLASDTAIFGDLNIIGHPNVYLDTTSMILGNVVGANTMTSFYDSTRDYCPILSLHGQIGLSGQLNTNGSGDITLTFPDPNSSGSAYNQVDLSTSIIAGTVTLNKANNSPSGDRAIAYITGPAQFDNSTSNSITVNGYASLDLKNSSYQQSSLNTSSTGFVDRTNITYIGATAAVAGTEYNITPKLPTSATYAAIATPTANTIIHINTKTNTSFKLFGSVAGVADVLLIRV